MNQRTQAIDMKMTWTSALPIMMAALRDGTEVGRREAVRELTNMACAADLAVHREKVIADQRKRTEAVERERNELMQAARLLMLNVETASKECSDNPLRSQSSLTIAPRWPGMEALREVLDRIAKRVTP